MLRHGSLFSGIGGFDLAAQRVGFENIFHCEWAEFPRKILKYYWPNSISYENIKTTDFNVHRGGIDILTGGFPCQPFSVAGKRLGKEDERHLWPEMCRAIREIQPRWVVGENVRGIISWNEGMVFEEVCSDLETEGYEVQAFILPACSVGAPHRRERVWFVAHAKLRTTGQDRNSNKTQGGGSSIVQEEGQGRYEQTILDNGLCGLQRFDFESRGFLEPQNWENFPTQHPVIGRDDGLSDKLDRITFSKWRNESLKAYGNAIVPKVAQQIFKAIIEYEKNMSSF
jgi:DNA (cytosine-5)-methyltransferase 1